jgi:hypothetical protein
MPHRKKGYEGYSKEHMEHPELAAFETLDDVKDKQKNAS